MRLTYKEWFVFILLFDDYHHHLYDDDDNDIFGTALSDPILVYHFQHWLRQNRATKEYRTGERQVEHTHD